MTETERIDKKLLSHLEDGQFHSPEVLLDMLGCKPKMMHQAIGRAKAQRLIENGPGGTLRLRPADPQAAPAEQPTLDTSADVAQESPADAPPA